MFDLLPWGKKDARDITSFRDEMNHLFNRFFDMDPMRFREGISGDFLFPSVDVSEGKKDVVVKAEIPGVDEKDIDVTLNGKMLTLKAEKKQEKKEEEKDFHKIERSYGLYKRSIELPADVDPTNVDATYKKGILTVTLKKAKESEAKKISVKSA